MSGGSWLSRLLNSLRKAPWSTRAIASLVAALLLVVIVWLLQALPKAEDPTWQRILETGTIRVCMDPSWPPFEYIDERTGEFCGLDVDLAGALAGRLAPGIQAQIVPVGFDSLYDALLAGRCDAVLSALPYEPERTQDLAYSMSYFNAGLVIVVRDETQDVGALDELLGRPIGVEWGFVPEGDMRQRLILGDLALRRYETAGDVLRALQVGEVEAALVDRVSALAYLHECRGLRITGAPLTDVSYVIPVRPDSFRLLEKINRVLLKIRDDGTMAELVDRWF